MKKIMLSAIMAVMTMLGLGSVAIMAPADCSAAKANSAYDKGNQYIEKINEGQQSDLMETVKMAINVIIGVVGIIAVVMIIVGGMNYTTSQGDAGKVKKAKDTILYGVIGLVVSLLAFAIVNFVLKGVFGS